jgi:cytochrome oxidase Cu insertion factor (SCO1/SenC/PrrC family)
LKLLRNKLFLVAAVCAAPIVLGTAAYLLAHFFGWSPGTASNYGELIAPRTVSAAPLGELRGKWVLVTFDAASCDAYCEKKLYFMRQVRRAQGKDMERIERLWVLTDTGKPRTELVAAIEGTRLGRFSPQEFPGKPADHIYLVDPLGNLMMRFPRDPDPSKMIKDLQRLLKYSRIG